MSVCVRAYVRVLASLSRERLSQHQHPDAARAGGVRAPTEAAHILPGEMTFGLTDASDWVTGVRHLPFRKPCFSPGRVKMYIYFISEMAIIFVIFLHVNVLYVCGICAFHCYVKPW